MNRQEKRGRFLLCNQTSLGCEDGFAPQGLQAAWMAALAAFAGPKWAFYDC